MEFSMLVNILNLPGLNVLDFKETDDEYHVNADPIRIDSGADPVTCQFARCRVMVALHIDKAGAGDPGCFLHIAVKGRGYRHHMIYIREKGVGRIESNDKFTVWFDSES